MHIIVLEIWPISSKYDSLVYWKFHRSKWPLLNSEHPPIVWNRCARYMAGQKTTIWFSPKCNPLKHVIQVTWLYTKRIWFFAPDSGPVRRSSREHHQWLRSNQLSVSLRNEEWLISEFKGTKINKIIIILLIIINNNGGNRNVRGLNIVTSSGTYWFSR